MQLLLGQLRCCEMFLQWAYSNRTKYSHFTKVFVRQSFQQFTKLIVFLHVFVDIFEGISSGSQHAIDLVIAFWSVSRTDVMPRWYVTAPERSPKTITSTKSVESDFVADFDSKNSYKRYAEDVYSPWTPQERYDRLSDANIICCLT